MVSRREFIRHAAIACAALPIMVRQNPRSVRPGQRPDTSGTTADTLADDIGTNSAPLGPRDNDPGVIAIERRLRCTCGCTLDVYTCRTTDFSCTYSPAMHQDVVARVDHGEQPDQIIAAFVARYGETVLMSPPARGFNLAGYLVPGLTVAAAGLTLVAWLSRRRWSDAVPVNANDRQPGGGSAAPIPSLDAQQLERLRRALDDVDS